MSDVHYGVYSAGLSRCSAWPVAKYHCRALTIAYYLLVNESEEG